MKTVKIPEASKRAHANIKKIEELMGVLHERIVVARENIPNADWGDVGTLAHYRKQLNNTLGFTDEDPEV